MPIKSLNSIFRGGNKLDNDVTPANKQYSKDVGKRGSVNVPSTSIAPLTPPVSPFYYGFQGQTIDLTHDVPASACVTISGPLPDDVFAMIVQQQIQSQGPTEHAQPSRLPTRSSSLAPSLSSLASSSSSMVSFSGPATPTTDGHNPLASYLMDNRKGLPAPLARSVESFSTTRPRNSRSNSRESMTERGVSWGTKRSLSERTICLEKREDEIETERQRESFERGLSGARAESKSSKHPGFRLSGIPLRSSSMVRSQSLGVASPSSWKVDRVVLPRSDASTSLRPPPAPVNAKYLMEKPLPKPATSPRSRSFAHSPIETSMLSPPLSAVGQPRGQFESGIKAPRLSRYNSERSGYVAPPSAYMGEYGSKTSTSNKRLTFGSNVVSPPATSSPRLSRNLTLSPRLSIQHPPTPPPDIPLPPLPMGETPSPRASRRFSQVPMPSRMRSPGIPSSRPDLQSRHSAASRLPTLRHQKSSPELGSSASWSRTSRRAPTPCPTGRGLPSPDYTQFEIMEPGSMLLIEEPVPESMNITKSPSFDAIGAMLEDPQGRSSLIVDTEPPWVEGTTEYQESPPMTSPPMGTWGTREAGFASRAPPMRKTESTGLEGIKLLLAQCRSRTEEVANARMGRANAETVEASEEYVVWGTAL